MNAAGTVDTNIENGIATIEFAHPKSNCLPGALLRTLAAEIDRLAADDSAKVILLRSAGERAFCAGASFDEIQAVKTLDQSKEFFSGFAIVIKAMRRCPKFIVTRVQGKAAGGAVGLISASDYALASSAAAVRLSELALGIGPFIIGPAVLRKVGTAAFSELSVSAEWRDAEWARQHGIFAGIYDSSAELDQALEQLLTRLSACYPAAMTRLKEVLWQGTENWEALLNERVTITSELALSDFVQDKIASFSK